MNIFVNLPFEFLRKIVLFSFGTTKFIFIVCDSSYITFMIFFIINKKVIMKYITHYSIIQIVKKNNKTIIKIINTRNTQVRG